jgi:hypothetical protein
MPDDRPNPYAPPKSDASAPDPATERRMARLARVSRIVGVAIVAVVLIVVVLRTMEALAELSSPALSEGDRVRIRASAVAGAAYDVVFGVVIAAPAFVVSAWARRRGRRAG